MGLSTNINEDIGPFLWGWGKDDREEGYISQEGGLYMNPRLEKPWKKNCSGFQFCTVPKRCCNGRCFMPCLLVHRQNRSSEHTDEMLWNSCTATAHLFDSLGIPHSPHPKHIIQQAQFSDFQAHKKLGEERSKPTNSDQQTAKRRKKYWKKKKKD